ncbi:hypothetical protein JOM56_014283 [Amanita muscaria]
MTFLANPCVRSVHDQPTGYLAAERMFYRQSLVWHQTRSNDISTGARTATSDSQPNRSFSVAAAAGLVPGYSQLLHILTILSAVAALHPCAIYLGLLKMMSCHAMLLQHKNKGQVNLVCSVCLMCFLFHCLSTGIGMSFRRH